MQLYIFSVRHDIPARVDRTVLLECFVHQLLRQFRSPLESTPCQFPPLAWAELSRSLCIHLNLRQRPQRSRLLNKQKSYQYLDHSMGQVYYSRNILNSFFNVLIAFALTRIINFVFTVVVISDNPS